VRVVISHNEKGEAEEAKGLRKRTPAGEIRLDTSDFLNDKSLCRFDHLSCCKISNENKAMELTRTAPMFRFALFSNLFV